MASIEFLTKRIAGKEKEIEKLEKKLSRIEKAEATGWAVNPYYYSERDKKYTIRDLEQAKEAINKYRAELERENEKANSRNVPAILEFLENWKIRVRKFYENSFDKYQTAYAEMVQAEKEYCDWWNNGGRFNASKEEKAAVDTEYRAKKKAFCERWNFITPYLDRQLDKSTRRYIEVLNIPKLVKDLEQEANAKYDDIIERTNKITGKITDASGLKVGAKGELNGYITGERGKAKVETIGAGGWNIQCYHFRTLIHEI